MGEESDAEPVVKKSTSKELQSSPPGLFGISYTNWALLLTALLTLWLFLALFFWLLLNIAVKMRSSDYKVLPYEFIGSDFLHTCADRDYGKVPCSKKSFSVSRNMFPWIDYACSLADPSNPLATSTCTEMTNAYAQYYYQSTT